MTWSMDFLIALMIVVCVLSLLAIGQIIWNLHAQRRREAFLASMRREIQALRDL